MDRYLPEMRDEFMICKSQGQLYGNLTLLNIHEKSCCKYRSLKGSNGHAGFTLCFIDISKETLYCERQNVSIYQS